MDRLTVRFPGRIQPHEEDKTLCDRLFYGMKGELKNGVRHMYDNPKITFSELLNKARKVELEDTETKNSTRVQAKGAIVGEISPMSKLQQQVAQLTTLVKSAQVGPKKSFFHKGEPKRNENQNNNVPNKEPKGDVQTQFKGSELSPQGPFGPGQRPIQCYKCKGWGHPRCLCPSRLNFTRGGGEHETKSFPTTGRIGDSHATRASSAESITSKVSQLAQRYHNPDPLI